MYCPHFFFNQQKFIKNPISAQNEYRSVKHKQKTLYIGGTLENKTPKEKPLRSTPKSTSPTKINNPT